MPPAFLLFEKWCRESFSLHFGSFVSRKIFISVDKDTQAKRTCSKKWKIFLFFDKTFHGRWQITSRCNDVRSNKSCANDNFFVKKSHSSQSQGFRRSDRNPWPLQLETEESGAVPTEPCRSAICWSSLSQGTWLDAPHWLTRNWLRSYACKNLNFEKDGPKWKITSLQNYFRVPFL